MKGIRAVSRRNKTRRSSGTATATRPATDSKLKKSRGARQLKTDREQQPNATPSRWFIVVVLLAAIWWIALGLTAIFTANPNRLNPVLIEQSDVIVRIEGTSSSKSIAVKEHWKGGEQLDSVAIVDLEEFELERGQDYLAPLTKRKDGRYDVTTGRVVLTIIKRPGEMTSTSGVVVSGEATVLEPDGQRAKKRTGDRVDARSRIEQGELKIRIVQAVSPRVYPAEYETLEQVEKLVRK